MERGQGSDTERMQLGRNQSVSKLMDFVSFFFLSIQIRGLTVMGHHKSRGGGCRISYGNPLKVSSTRRSPEGTLRGIASGTRPNRKTE